MRQAEAVFGQGVRRKRLIIKGRILDNRTFNQVVVRSSRTGRTKFFKHLAYISLLLFSPGVTKT